MASTRLTALLERRAADRRLAPARARAALAWLAEQGVDAAVVGSLARGTFRAHSEVGLLVLGCPPDRRYALESGVERILEELPFDLIYLDGLPESFRQKALAEAVRAPVLR